MKSKILKTITLIQLFSILIAAISVDGQTNYSNIELNSSKIQVTMQKDTSLRGRVSAIEDQKNNNDERIMLNLKQSTFLVEIMALILTLFLGIVGYFNLYEFKKMSNKINILFDKTNVELQKVVVLEKKLSGNQTYLHQGFESLYELLQISSNFDKNKDFLKLIFIKRAISQLYSDDVKERFIGITTLGERGGLSDIVHLENVILNPDEGNNNKQLANNAIVNIKTRNLDIL